jgi:hypothetical protein
METDWTIISSVVRSGYCDEPIICPLGTQTHLRGVNAVLPTSRIPPDFTHISSNIDTFLRIEGGTNSSPYLLRYGMKCE